MIHYFRLHLVCKPGGSRKTEYHVYGTVKEVLETLYEDLSSPEGAYHALFYGEEIFVQCWQDGRLIDTIDLHPYITYRLEGIESDLKFTDLGDEPLLLSGSYMSEEMMYNLCQGMVAINVVVDENSIPWPELVGDPLEPGNMADFGESSWKYGSRLDWDNYIT